LGLETTLQVPQLAGAREVTADFVENLRGIPAACVVILVELDTAGLTTKIRRSREKAVVSVKREEKNMQAPHFQNSLSIIAEVQRKREEEEGYNMVKVWLRFSSNVGSL